MKSDTRNNVMFVGFFVFMMGGLLTLCQPTFAQDVKTTRVTLNDNQQPLKVVFREIEQQTGFTIEFRNNILDQDKRISISVTKEPLGTVMEKLLKGTGTVYIQKNKSILIIRDDQTVPPAKSSQINASGAVVKGVVTSTDGETLPFVNIVLKGTTKGIQTNPAGEYSITTTGENPVLIVSHTGYESREIAVNNRETVDIRMNISRSSLNEVVVTALNMKRSAKVWAIPSLHSMAAR